MTLSHEPVPSFDQLSLDPLLLKALATQGYTIPTPIQAQAIPVVLEGKDVFGCAQTGTGKTAAFSLPLLHILHNSPRDHAKPLIRALILTPTRELAIQIEENISQYGAHLDLSHTVIFGGVSDVHQIKKLRQGMDILVATPGRLLDLINRKHINIQHVEFFVLDEADRMLDMGFINDVKKILNRLPKKRQTVFFSATVSPEIMSLAKTILHDPISITVTPASSTVDTVSQALYTVSKENKNNLLLHLLKNPDIVSAVVFTKTKHGANKVEKFLSQASIPSAAIHGNKSQNARQNALKNLKDGSIRILVATDVAARGIDIDELSHVIIYDVPLEPESYVHRIGRTGRAGLSGVSVMFCEPDEVKYLKQVVKLIGKPIPHVVDHPFHSPHSTTVARPSSPSSQRGGGRGGQQGGNRSSGRGGQQGRRDGSSSHSSKSNGPKQRHAPGSARQGAGAKAARQPGATKPSRQGSSAKPQRNDRPRRSK